jgi:hypothetical protein
VELWTQLVLMDVLKDVLSTELKNLKSNQIYLKKKAK